MELLTNAFHWLLSLPWYWDVAGAVFIAWVAFWNIQGWLLSHRSGYFAPRLSFLPQLVRYSIGVLVGRWFVGPVRVYGWENLQGYNGRVVIAPNHQQEADIWLVGMGLRMRKIRFLMAINQTKGFLRGPLFAWMGAISVGYDPKNPAAAAARSAIEVMKQERDSSLIIFPQGELVRDDVWDKKRFRKGAIRIARASQEATGETFAVLPVVGQYDYDPMHATLFQRIVRALGIRRRFLGRKPIYNATIMIGKPLPVSSLPEDDDAALEVYFEAMLATREQCRKACPSAAPEDSCGC